MKSCFIWFCEADFSCLFTFHLANFSCLLTFYLTIFSLLFTFYSTNVSCLFTFYSAVKQNKKPDILTDICTTLPRRKTTLLQFAHRLLGYIPTGPIVYLRFFGEEFTTPKALKIDFYNSFLVFLLAPNQSSSSCAN